MQPENISISFLMLCGTVAASIGLFASRFRKYWVWRGTTSPVSLRSRILVCAWLLGWTMAALFGPESSVTFAPILASVLLVLSYSSDRRKHEGDA
ncbi:MAG: hypothetical protein JWR69_2226 [Pedosphaera sp.]|nr:hypothetical protein [Pedosphaera sp.]